MIERLLEELVIEDSGAEFTGDAFRLFCGPIVYLFLRDGKPLYIGMSSAGLSRPGGRVHHKAAARDQADQVKTWSCRTVRDARKLEAILIHQLKPSMNGRGQGHTNVELGEIYSMPIVDSTSF